MEQLRLFARLLGRCLDLYQSHISRQPMSEMGQKLTNHRGPKSSFVRSYSNSGHSHHRWMSRAKTPTADSVRHARGTRPAGAPETIRTPDLCTGSFHA